MFCYQESSSPILAAKFSPSSPKKNIQHIKGEYTSDPVISNLNITVVKATEIGTIVKPKTRDPKSTETEIKARLLKIHTPIKRLRYILEGAL